MSAANPAGSDFRAPVVRNISTVNAASPERISSGSAPQIQDESGFAGEHVAAIAPSLGHGTAGDPRIPRAATHTLTEELLEAAIVVASARMCAAPTRAEKLEAWRELCVLIDQRTPSRRRFNARMREIQSPPSEPTRIAQASVGCRGNAAGGGS